MIVRKILIGLLVSAICFGVGRAINSKMHQPIIDPAPVTSTAGKIQVALLLDTSGSMSGLIEQAKSQLWNILNELARTEKDNTETELEIALYEYGNPAKASTRIQINQLAPFTTDMDMISEKLFSLTTTGGDEYCGAVIKSSLDELDWSNGDRKSVV